MIHWYHRTRLSVSQHSAVTQPNSDAGLMKMYGHVWSEVGVKSTLSSSCFHFFFTCTYYPLSPLIIIFTVHSWLQRKDCYATSHLCWVELIKPCSSGGKFYPEHLNGGVKVNSSRLWSNLRSNIGAVWEYALSASHCIHSERLAGTLCLVLCQGCTEETAWVLEMGLREARGLFTVNCLQCVPFCVWLSGRVGDWVVQAGVTSAQSHKHSALDPMWQMGAEESIKCHMFFQS